MNDTDLTYQPFFRIMEVRQGVNKQNEIKRLVFEIKKKYGFTTEEFLIRLQKAKSRLKKKWNYRVAKQVLVKMRYPESFSRLEQKDLYFPLLKPVLADRYHPRPGAYRPGRIITEKKVEDHPLTRKVIHDCPGAETEIIRDIRDLSGRSTCSPGSMGKNELYLVEQKYDILKPCPCSRSVSSCGYWILNIGFGCGYDCSYCYLQHYSNAPGVILPVNIEFILDQLAGLLAKIKRPLRIGTGEFTDSLLFDHLIPYSKYLVPFFSRSPHCLELKTKSANIAHLLEMKPSPSIVVSWSLNAPTVIRQEESGAPDLDQRLMAIKAVVGAGYRIGLHFDPLVYFKGWEEEYRSTVSRVLGITGKQLAWISLGALRFHRTLKPIIEQRFPDNRILDGELILDGKDRKMRYSPEIRLRLFSAMTRWIREVFPECVIYLCMEPAEMSVEVLGATAAF